MKNVKGIWLPDGDSHIAGHLADGPLHNGKGTYQFVKIEAAILRCEAEGRTGIALDIGAHVGTWSMILAETFDRVIAFEPMPHLFECLQKNLEGVENVRLNNFAVSSNGGPIRMASVVENSGNCRVATDKDRETITARAVSLDRAIADYPAGVDFIKIDVEGYETAVITGAENLIKRCKPFIMIEQKPGTDGRYGFKQFTALELLKSWGMVEIYKRSGDYLLRFP